MMALQHMRSSKRRGAARGFTLPELLISMAILSILTLALFMLFRSSLSAFKSTKKAMDASEETHTAFRVLERDLAQGYAAKHYGDSANFFGCPYGFSMIATLDAAGQARTARVSYVVHSFAGIKAVETLSDDPSTPSDEPVDAQLLTFGIIRYIEPGVDKLNEYPVQWPDYTGPPPPPEAPESPLYQPLREIYDQFGPAGPSPVPAAQLESMLQARKHELWLAMLGDREEPFGRPLPRLWDDQAAPGTTWGGGPNFAALWDGKYPEDYLIAEGVAQADPDTVFYATNPVYTSTTYNGESVILGEAFANVRWFRYGYTPRDVEFIDMGLVETVPYWNAVDPLNIGMPGDPNYPFINLAGSPLYPFPPSLVEVNMAFAFPAPNLGERHYVRKLAHTFQIPVGYRRPTLEQP